MVSEKEIEAAMSGWHRALIDAPDESVYERRRRCIRAALEAAARVRGGAPISLADAEKAFLDRVWPRLQNGCYRAHNLIPIEIQRLDFNEFIRDGLRAVFEAAASQPSGPVQVKPLANLIHDALAFAVWAAGEGLCPTDGTPAPEDFLYAYSAATGFENWDAIPHHSATTLSALTAGKPEQAVPSGKHWFAVQSPTGVHIGLWDDGKIAYGVAAEYGSDYTIMELVELPAAPTAGGGKAAQEHGR